MINIKRLFSLTSIFSFSVFAQAYKPQVLARCGIENAQKEIFSCFLTLDDLDSPFPDTEVPLKKECALTDNIRIRMEGTRVQDSPAGIADSNPTNEDLAPSFKNLKVSLVPTNFYLESHPRAGAFKSMDLASTRQTVQNKSSVERKTSEASIFGETHKITCLFLR